MFSTLGMQQPNSSASTSSSSRSLNEKMSTATNEDTANSHVNQQIKRGGTGSTTYYNIGTPSSSMIQPGTSGTHSQTAASGTQQQRASPAPTSQGGVPPQSMNMSGSNISRKTAGTVTSISPKLGPGTAPPNLQGTTANYMQRSVSSKSGRSSKYSNRGATPSVQFARNEGRKVIERWVFSYKSNLSLDLTSSTQINRQDHTIMRRLAVGIRALFCHTRALPGFNLFLKKQTLQFDMYFLDSSANFTPVQPEELFAFPSSIGCLYLSLGKSNLAVREVSTALQSQLYEAPELNVEDEYVQKTSYNSLYCLSP